MLSAGRILASIATGAVEKRAAQLVLAGSAGCVASLPGRLTAACGGQWRFAQNDAGAGQPEGTAAASSSTNSGTPAFTATQAKAEQPASSPEARALADQLKQASPTGRLFDLFTPTDPGPSRPGRGPRTPAAAGSSTSPTAAAPAASTAPTVDTDVVSVVMRAVENCRPLMRVRQFKIGQRMTPVPRPLAPEASTKLAVKWILQAATKRRESARGSSASMAEALATELLLAYQRKGGARNKREELHKLALDNRANVRARWW